MYRSLLLVILKPENLQLYCKHTPWKKDLGGFCYLLQFLRTVRLILFYRKYFMAAYEIGTKTDENYW